METYEKYLDEARLSKKEKLENLIRNNLSGTDRKTTKDKLWVLIKHQTTGLTKKLFDKVFNELVDDEYLVKTKDGKYKWEM